MKIEEIFADIYKAHPQMDLNDFKDILLKINKEQIKGIKPTKTDLAKQLGEKRSKISSRVDILEEFEYVTQLGRSKAGKNIFFLSIEDEKAIFDYTEQDRAIAEHESKLLDRINKDKEVKRIAGEELIDNFIVSMRASYRDALPCYSRIIEILDLAGMKQNLKQVQFKSLALRTALRPKGELAVIKLKGENEEKPSTTRAKDKIGSDKADTAEAA